MDAVALLGQMVRRLDVEPERDVAQEVLGVLRRRDFVQSLAGQVEEHVLHATQETSSEEFRSVKLAVSDALKPSTHRLGGLDPAEWLQAGRWKSAEDLLATLTGSIPQDESRNRLSVLILRCFKARMEDQDRVVAARHKTMETFVAELIGNVAQA